MRSFVSYALFLVVLVVFTAVPSARSQEVKKDVLKIGYVDLQRIIFNSKAGKSATNALKVKFKAKSDIIEQKASALEKMKQDFIKNSTVMKESVKKQKADRIKKQEKDLNRTREDFREEFQKESIELERKILREMEKNLIEIVQSEGYDIILEQTRSGLVFASPQVDITEKVIRSYDQSYDSKQ